MKRLVCDCCGSNALTEENGFFVCEYCGSKHYFEKENELSSAVNITSDGTTIDSLLIRARYLYAETEYVESQDLYSQVLTREPFNAEALICRELCRLWLNTDNPLESFAKLKEVFLKNASGFLNNKQKESNLDFFGFIIRQISGFINSTGEKLSGFWTGNSPLLMNLQMDALDLCDYYVAIINNTDTGQETFYYSVLFNIESIYKFSFLSKIISPENIIKIIDRCTKILNALSISQANEECNIKRSELLKLFSENRITDELDIEQFAQNDPNVFLCGTGQYIVFKGDHIVYVNNMKNQEIFYKDYKKAKKFFMGVQIRPKSPFKSGLFYEIQNGRQEEFIKKWNSLV